MSWKDNTHSALLRKLADTEAEVARLREELAEAADLVAATARSFNELHAAHEATKAAASEALDTREARIRAAEARVAELEQQRDDARRRYYTEAQTRIARDAALDQAREELAQREGIIGQLQSGAMKLELDALTAERAAHEATKAALEKANQNFVEQHRNAVIPAINRADAAEQRVAELEARGKHVGEEVSRICGEREQACLERDVARAALDQARGLLEYLEKGGRPAIGRVRAWLRANPATATPAATGAEPKHDCDDPDCQRCRHLAPLRAAKENK